MMFYGGFYLLADALLRGSSVLSSAIKRLPHVAKPLQSTVLKENIFDLVSLTMHMSVCPSLFAHCIFRPKREKKIK